MIDQATDVIEPHEAGQFLVITEAILQRHDYLHPFGRVDSQVGQSRDLSHFSLAHVMEYLGDHLQDRAPDCRVAGLAILHSGSSRRVRIPTTESSSPECRSRIVISAIS